MKKIILFCLFVFPLFSRAETLRFPYNPSLSPDGKVIYFSYDGDIFRVPAEGGLAMRLVSLGGNEITPKVSPDGKYLAFASNIQGNNDVYIVPVDGGEVRRLTWHEAGDVPVGWTPDSKQVYFESTRANLKTTWRIPIAGGTPVRLFGNYFNTIVNLAENPVTGELYFNESGESISFPTRKRYVGDHNPNILSWNPGTKEYKELTSYTGKDSWPMVDKKGNLYYVSDEYNKESNIVKYNPAGKPVQLTTFTQSVQYPSVSYDGSGMVFLLEYKIQYLDLTTGKVIEPQITVADNKVEIERAFADQAPTEVAVSPDGKKFALAIRGLLYISDVEGKYLKRLSTPDNERVDEIIWGPDNNTVYYTRTNKGYTHLFKIKADGSVPEKAVYVSPNMVNSLTMSHKRDKIVFICGNRDIMLLNMADDSVTKLAESEFWSYGSYTMNFSFDDSYLAFEAMYLFDMDIYLYSFKEKKLYSLTNSACGESDPCFSPDGKYLYLTANLYNASFPRGGGVSQIYKLPLVRYNNIPFRSDAYDNLFKKEPSEKPVSGKKKEGKMDKTQEAAPKKDSTVKVDFSDVFRRLIPLEESGNGLYVHNQKEKSWLLYSSKGKVYSLEISDPEAKPKEIRDLVRGYYIASDKELYAVSGGDIYKIDLNFSKAAKTTIKKSVEKNLNKEFEQMFYEAWALIEQNFYDVHFHGVDWAAKRDYYASFLPDVRNRANLVTLVNDMLGELNSSHLGFHSLGKEETAPQTQTVSLETGIIWKNEAPYTVDRILTDSPANSVEIDVKPGDVLMAVNGTRVLASANRESYFTSSVKEPEIKLTFRRGDKEFDVKLHTVSYGAVREMGYTEWEDINKARVDQLGKGRIAYTHMRDMGNEALNKFLKDMYTDAVNKDALILDLRYNDGGNVHKEVLDFLQQKAHFNWGYRNFTPNSHPNVTPGDKPIVVLVNERSLSDAEVTSNGIKTLGIAKIIGTETYRWIIFTSGAMMLDGSFLRLPAWGCYSLDGKDLEATGVSPDVYVKNTFKDRLDGNDPQLDRAIQEILTQLGIK